MRSSRHRITVTDDHLKLLQRMYVRWDDCETGAPAVDPKRPYGNSDVPGDVAEILGWELTRDRYGDDILTEEQANHALAVHREMDTVLQVLVQHPLDFATGEGKQAGSFYENRWERA